MFRNRLIGFFGLAIAIGMMACASPQKAFAAVANPFTWGSYKGTDNNNHNYPRWVNIPNQNGKVNFDIGQGSATDPAGWTPTSAVVKVYKPSAVQPGGYEATPSLQMTTTNFITVAGTSTMAWSDPANPKIVFDSGITVMVVVTITYKNNANNAITQDVVMPAFYVDTTAF